MQKVNLKRLNAIKAAPLGVEKIEVGRVAPDPSDLPITEDADGNEIPLYEREVKDPKDHQTIEDRLVALCDALGGAHRYRDLLEGGGVQLRVKLNDGTMLGGIGANTQEAFNALLEKAQKFEAAGLVEEVDA